MKRSDKAWHSAKTVLQMQVVFPNRNRMVSGSQPTCFSEWTDSRGLGDELFSKSFSKSFKQKPGEMVNTLEKSIMKAGNRALQKTDHMLVRVTSQEEIAEGVYLTGFEKRFDYTPGQVVKISTSMDIPARLYSIASGNQEASCKILYDVKPEGQLTRRLAALKPGEQLYVSQPFGSFLQKGMLRYLIATGTGIAPFLSMILSGLTENTFLIHGSRTLQGFYLSETLQDILGGRYTRCSSGEEVKGVYQGRVTSYLKEQHLSLSAFYYLCGSTEMVVDTRQVLIDKGVPYDHIIAEIFF